MVDFLVATGLALIFLALSWSFARAVSGGRRLNPFKRKVLLYSFVFVLGEAYIMVFASHMHWLKELLFPMIGAWGAMLALVAWWRCRRESG
jgi:vacuolar-type H+-ATPase subunit I/STV1